MSSHKFPNQNDSDNESDFTKDDTDMFPKLDLFDKPDSSDEDIKSRNRIANPKKIMIKVISVSAKLNESTELIFSNWMFNILEKHQEL
jgi:hypothetical protein